MGGADSMVPTWWSNIYGTISWQNRFTKPLCPPPLIGVNRTWTERNDCAPKVNVLIFFLYMPKRGSFRKNKKLSSLTILFVFSCLHLLFPKKCIITRFIIPSLLDPCFFLLEHLFLSLPLQNPLDHVIG